jgi:hypothetical protein
MSEHEFTLAPAFLPPSSPERSRTPRRSNVSLSDYDGVEERFTILEDLLQLGKDDLQHLKDEVRLGKDEVEKANVFDHDHDAINHPYRADRQSHDKDLVDVLSAHSKTRQNVILEPEYVEMTTNRRHTNEELGVNRKSHSKKQYNSEEPQSFKRIQSDSNLSGSSKGRSKERPDKRKKEEQIKQMQASKLDFLRPRIEGEDGEISFHVPSNGGGSASTSMSEICPPSGVSIDLAKRMEELDAVLRKRQPSAAPRRAIVGGSRGVLASPAFWEELRARVHGRTLEEERAWIAMTRSRVPDVIAKVKTFHYAPPPPAPTPALPSPSAAPQPPPPSDLDADDDEGVAEVRRAAAAVRALLAEVEEVEAAYPYTHACGQHRLERPNGLRLDEPRGLAVDHPEWSCGSLHDNSTFVSNLEVRPAGPGPAGPGGVELRARPTRGPARARVRASCAACTRA